MGNRQIVSLLEWQIPATSEPASMANPSNSEPASMANPSNSEPASMANPSTSEPALMANPSNSEPASTATYQLTGSAAAMVQHPASAPGAYIQFYYVFLHRCMQFEMRAREYGHELP
ncbi:hypothetical protein N7G274_010940 [Stereocaulon virgatum]|uniref:Uncharacterized protein n=1 Tax=Stereocaulon virgatum TaxID=373712 RepID=A0ABR3ZTB9_9LECA